MADRRANRDEWQKRVERWRESGLTAKQFAAESGINAGTLQFWKYKVKKRTEVRDRPRRSKSADAAIAASLIEIRPARVDGDSRFEIELCNGRRVRVPTLFEPASLMTLLRVVDPAS